MLNKSIFDNSQKIKIEDHQSELLKDESEHQYDNYLSKVFEEVNKSLENYFKKDYIFAKSYYLPSEEKPPLTTVSFCPQSTKNIAFSNGIMEAEKLVKEKTASSLAEYVVNYDVLGVMIYKCTKEYEIKYEKKHAHGIPKFPKMTNYRLDDRNNPFVKIDSENPSLKTSAMVEKHRQMINDSGYDEVFEYVLRTRNLDKDFNGTLFLVLTRPIEIEEYREIIDYFTFIMQVRIKYEVSFRISKTEWRKIAEYRSHALHFQHQAKEGIKTNLRDAFANKDAVMFAENMRRMDAIDNYTKDFDDMAYALQKIQFKKSNYDALEKNDKIKSLLSPQKLELRKTIIECIEMIRLSIDLIRFEGEEAHKAKIRDRVLSELTAQVKKNFGPLNLQVVPEIFKVVIQDIMKNAVKFTDKKKPVLQIWVDDLDKNEVPPEVQKQLEKDKEYFAIVFKNNKAIDEKTFDFLLHGKITDDMPLEKRVSLGVTTIHRLTGYDGIGLSGLRWFFTPSTECLKPNMKYTKTLLIIPKNDLA